MANFVTITGVVHRPENREFEHHTFLRHFEKLHKLHKHRGTLTPAELAAKVSTFYWEVRNREEYDCMDVHEFLDSFYAYHFKMRVAYEKNEVVAVYCIIKHELVGLISSRKGLGSWLLAHAESDGATRLNTFAGNPVQHLLSKLWRSIRTEPNWLGEGPPVIYYEK